MNVEPGPPESRQPFEATPEEAATQPIARRDRLRQRAHQARLYGWTALLIIALVVIIALIVDNTRRVTIGWVFGSSRTSLVWIIVVAAIVGWFAGLATSFVVRRRIRRAMEH
ncbi:MAG TPA: LapA family protein [Gaiellaceae bacterium]|nr:LapA family protein [Gaiellaceae bacterium]